jgi:hypothetical protein
MIYSEILEIVVMNNLFQNILLKNEYVSLRLNGGSGGNGKNPEIMTKGNNNDNNESNSNPSFIIGILVDFFIYLALLLSCVLEDVPAGLKPTISAIMQHVMNLLKTKKPVSPVDFYYTLFLFVIDVLVDQLEKISVNNKVKVKLQLELIKTSIKKLYTKNLRRVTFNLGRTLYATYGKLSIKQLIYKPDNNGKRFCDLKNTNLNDKV